MSTTTGEYAEAEAYALSVAARFLAHFPAWLDRDDVYVQVRLAVHSAAERWSPDRGVPFLCFVRPWVDGAIRRETSHQQRGRALCLLGLPADTPDGGEKAEQGSGSRFHRRAAQGAVPAWSEGAIGCIVADPARIVIDAEEAERLWAAVERLPAKQRAIVLLRFRDGLTLAEAGRALGLSRTRVHELERLALSRLRCVMEHAPDRGLERSGCPR